jgi:hypothetical protein
VSPVKCELGVLIPEDAILHSHCRETLRSYILIKVSLKRLFIQLMLYPSTVVSNVK